MILLGRALIVAGIMLLGGVFCFIGSYLTIYWALVGNLPMTLFELGGTLFWGSCIVYIWRRRKLHPRDWIPFVKQRN